MMTTMMEQVNAVGTAVTPDNITLETKIEYHWYLKNLTSNTMVREMQTFVGGTDIYGEIQLEICLHRFYHLGIVYHKFLLKDFKYL